MATTFMLGAWDSRQGNSFGWPLRWQSKPQLDLKSPPPPQGQQTPEAAKPPRVRLQHRRDSGVRKNPWVKLL